MAAKPATAETAPTMTLVEFCTRLSETERRPELIAAFEHHAKKSNLKRETWEGFKSRFDAFVTLPA